MFTTPILFLVFNRPDTTSQVFNIIREIRPIQLFIAADGPRPCVMSDTERCKEVRELVSAIDWDCKVTTLFREKNLGCKNAISSAITWFFEHVEEGIILEDDTLPAKSFFSYCQSLLSEYRDVSQIMHISGVNFQFNQKYANESYYFSKYFHVWGWATWRRAWSKYVLELGDIKNLDFFSKSSYYTFSKVEYEYWLTVFQAVAKDEIDTWDYQWLYAIWKTKGLCITPTKNLVSNIGFGKNATHTQNTDSLLSAIPLQEFAQVSHPKHIRVNHKADNYTFNNAIHQTPTFWQLIKKPLSVFLPIAFKNRLKRILP
jgi:hypothetical protein